MADTNFSDFIFTIIHIYKSVKNNMMMTIIMTDNTRKEYSGSNCVVPSITSSLAHLSASLARQTAHDLRAYLSASRVGGRRGQSGTLCGIDPTLRIPRRAAMEYKIEQQFLGDVRYISGR